MREALDHVWEIIDRELQDGTLEFSPSRRGRRINMGKSSSEGQL